FERYPAATLATYLPRLEARARGGERRAYFDLMRFSYAILRAEEPSRLDFDARRLGAYAQEYLHSLESNDSLGPEERLRYAFAASRILQAAHANAVSRSPASLAASCLSRWLRDFDGAMEALAAEIPAEDGSAAALAGIMAQIRLREALLGGEAIEAGSQARA